MKSKIRIGIVGVGSMGGTHARNILANKIERAELTAVCDTSSKNLAQFPHVTQFSSTTEMFASGKIDAVVIATPHFSHTDIGIEAFHHDVHVLMEKPVSVHKADCERLYAEYREPLVFAAMFDVRTEPRYIELRRLIQSGQLGAIRRINWIVTDWFRTEAYYASGSWRATWAGEGGGLLVNQCPHNLDLFQWIFGLPKTVRGFCQIGKYHQIEVEDEVTAYFEYADRATAVFIATTGEAPGTNRLEVAGENGHVLVHPDHLAFTRNTIPMTEFSRTTKAGFDKPPVWDVKIPLHGHAGHHIAVLQNFVNAILDGEPLIAPGHEGIHSVELANAIVLSSFTNKEVQLPMNSAEYAALLDEKIKTSRFRPQPNP
jgi:predicted dehydrogenase